MEFSTKRIAIDIASLIYHGIMRIYPKKDDAGKPSKGEFVILDDP